MKRKNPLDAAVQLARQSGDAIKEGVSEMSKGITWIVEKGVERVQDTLTPPADTPMVPKKPTPGKGAARKGAKAPEPKAATQKTPAGKKPSRKSRTAPAARPDKSWLLQQARDNIHRTYHAEGGFRYFAGNLCRYIRVVLPRQTQVEEMHTGAYSSCIQPMCRNLAKLEKSLQALRMQWDGAPMVPENQALLDDMKRFAARAEQDRLNTPEGWEAEDYRCALIRYGAELQQLLDAWPEPEE